MKDIIKNFLTTYGFLEEGPTLRGEHRFVCDYTEDAEAIGFPQLTACGFKDFMLQVHGGGLIFEAEDYGYNNDAFSVYNKSGKYLGWYDPEYQVVYFNNNPFEG